MVNTSAKVPHLGGGRQPPNRLLLAVIGIATAIAFSRVLFCDFVNWDDDIYVYDNAHLRAGLGSDGIGWAITGVRGGYWIPVTWLSLLADYQLFGLRPWGYHLTNLLLHVANALLTYVLFNRWTGQSYRSFVAAALFALHPLRVESVAWVTERKDVLSVFFGLLALLAYEHYAVQRGGLRWYLLVMGTFTLSLLAKPMLVTLPFLLLLLDYWPLRRWRSGALPAEGIDAPPSLLALLAEKVPLVANAIVFSFITLQTQKEVGAVQSLDFIPFFRRAAVATIAYVRYLQMTVAPLGLAPFYPYLPEDLTPGRVALAALVLASISALALWQARRCPALIVGWCWYLGTLLPVSGLLQSGQQALADRFTYFPSIGLFLALTWCAADVLGTLRWQAALASVVIFVSAVATNVQARRWQDSVTLWSWTLKATGRNGMAHHNLGEALEKRREWRAALAEFDKSLAINPHYARAHYNRGVVLEQLNHLEDALASLQRACDLAPDYVSAHYNMGVVLFRLERPREAAAQFEEVLALDRGHARAAFNLGQTQLVLGQPAAAVQSFETALSLSRTAAGYKALGHALMLTHRDEQAVRAFQSALLLDPADPETRAALAAVQKK